MPDGWDRFKRKMGLKVSDKLVQVRNGKVVEALREAAAEIKKLTDRGLDGSTLQGRHDLLEGARDAAMQQPSNRNKTDGLDPLKG